MTQRAYHSNLPFESTLDRYRRKCRDNCRLRSEEVLDSTIDCTYTASLHHEDPLNSWTRNVSPLQCLTFPFSFPVIFPSTFVAGTSTQSVSRTRLISPLLPALARYRRGLSRHWYGPSTLVCECPIDSRSGDSHLGSKQTASFPPGCQLTSSALIPLFTPVAPDPFPSKLPCCYENGVPRGQRRGAALRRQFHTLTVRTSSCCPTPCSTPCCEALTAKAREACKVAMPRLCREH